MRSNLIDSDFRYYFWGLVAVLAVAVVYIAFTFVPSEQWYYIVATIAVVAITVVWLLYASYITVNPNEAAIFAIYGKKVILVEPGWYIFVPAWFIKTEWFGAFLPFMKEIEYPMFPEGKIDLVATTSIVTKAYYRIVIFDPNKAAYNVANYEKAVATEMSRCFSDLMVNIVEDMKQDMKESIKTSVGEDADNADEEKKSNDLEIANQAKGKINAKNFFTKSVKFEGDPFGIQAMMKENWGVSVVSVGVIDIKRLKLKQAEIDAHIKKQEGVGLGSKVDRLAFGANLTAVDAAHFLTDQAKWDAIKNSSNADVVVFEGGDQKTAREGYIHGVAAAKADRRRPIEVKKQKNTEDASTQKDNIAGK